MENQSIVHDAISSPTLEKSGQVHSQDGQSNSSSLPLQVRDVQESVRVLRNQIAFAQQCLGLLNNQMKHAGDTLEILQDQIVKAEETITQIGIPLCCAAGKEHNSVTTNAVYNLKHVICTQEDADGVIQSSTSDRNYHKVCTHENERQQVVFLGRSSRVNLKKSRATPNIVRHQKPKPSSESEGICSCSNYCSEVEIIDKTNNTAAGVAEKESQKADANKTVTREQSKQGLHIVGETTKIIGTDANSKSLVPEESQAAPTQQAQKVEGGQSTSPMASQLLQVIDVLQSAADDDPKLGHAKTPTTPLSAGSLHNSGFVYSVPPPESGIMPMASSQAPMSSYVFPRRERTPRKSRKQSNSPQISPNMKHSGDQVRHHADFKELMLVPQPVLASTLEPEFIVVPASGGAPSPLPHPPEGEVFQYRSSSSDLDDSKRSTPCAEIKQEPPDSPKSQSSVSGSFSGEAESVATGNTSAKSNQRSFNATTDDEPPKSTTTKAMKQKIDNVVQNSKITPTARSSLLNRPFTALQSQNTDSIVHDSECTADGSYGFSNSTTARNGEATTTPPLIPSAGDVQRLCTNSHSAVTVLKNDTMVDSDGHSPPIVSRGVQPHEQTIVNQCTSSNSHLTEVVSQPLTSLPFVVTNSTAHTKTASSPRRPNILSRKRDKSGQMTSVPEGLVVLVPTLEDAKKLISSSGRHGRTPVLVPEHLAQNFQKSSQKNNITQDNSISVDAPAIHQSPLNTPEPANKRRNVESVILE